MKRVLVSESSRKWARILDDRWERWRIRHESNLPVIKPSITRRNDLKAYLESVQFSRQSLIALRFELESVVSEIKADIEVAKQLNRNGMRIPDNEFKELKANRQWVASKLNIVTYIYSKSKPRFIKENAKYRNFSHYFMDAAKEILDDAIFDKILNEAEKRKRNEILAD